MKRIAICLSGQLRTFETAYPGILRYFNSVNPDYFIHTWSANTWHKKNVEKVIPHIHTQIDEDDINLAVSIFNPKKYQIDKNKIFDVDMSQSQQFSAMSSNELKKQYEIENNFKYDVVVKCRFDIIWNPLTEFNITNVDEKTIFFSYIDRNQFPEYPMALDRVYFGNSQTMDEISQIYFVTTDYIEKRINNKFIESEHGLYQMCCNLNLDIKETHNHEIIVRKQAEGLNHITDFEKIKQIHLDFFNMNKPDKLI
jgi:hypothetical protein